MLLFTVGKFKFEVKWPRQRTEEPKREFRVIIIYRWQRKDQRIICSRLESLQRSKASLWA